MAALIGFVCEAFLYGSFSASTANKVDCSFLSRVLYDSLRSFYLSETQQLTPLERRQQPYFRSRRVIVSGLYHPLRPGVPSFLLCLGMRHAIFYLRNL
jgi:hypothetical protein